MNDEKKKNIGVCILTRHPPQYRTLKKEERQVIDEKKRELNKLWFEKKGVARLGVYNPVWGTEYSTMEFWEFPDINSLAEYRRAISKIEGHVTFFKFLMGSRAHWIK